MKAKSASQSGTPEQLALLQQIDQEMDQLREREEQAGKTLRQCGHRRLQLLQRVAEHRLYQVTGHRDTGQMARKRYQLKRQDWKYIVVAERLPAAWLEECGLLLGVEVLCEIVLAPEPLRRRLFEEALGGRTVAWIRSAREVLSQVPPGAEPPSAAALEQKVLLAQAQGKGRPIRSVDEGLTRIEGGLCGLMKQVEEVEGLGQRAAGERVARLEEMARGLLQRLERMKGKKEDAGLQQAEETGPAASTSASTSTPASTSASTSAAAPPAGPAAPEKPARKATKPEPYSWTEEEQAALDELADEERHLQHNAELLARQEEQVQGLRPVYPPDILKAMDETPARPEQRSSLGDFADLFPDDMLDSIKSCLENEDDEPLLRTCPKEQPQDPQPVPPAPLPQTEPVPATME